MLMSWEDCQYDLVYRVIPKTMIDTIHRYVKDGLTPGSFTMALLTNDLISAVSRADEYNSKILKELVTYCYNELPISCWGSEAKVIAWLQLGGLKGKNSGKTPGGARRTKVIETQNPSGSQNKPKKPKTQ